MRVLHTLPSSLKIYVYINIYISFLFQVLFCLVYIQYVELAISKCNKCPPGTFVLARCNKTAQTICEPCKVRAFINSYKAR